MSEENVYSTQVLIGAAKANIVKFIEDVCGAVCQYQPKNEYIATPEREMLLHTLYNKNLAKLEDKYLLGNENKTFHKKHIDAPEREVQLRAIHSMSMFESISQIDPIAFVAEKKHEDNLGKIHSAISKMKKQLKAPTFNLKEMNELADKSESLIRKVTTDTNRLLAKAEEELSLDIVKKTISSLAYKVKTSGMTFTAAKGDIAIRGKVECGQIKLDTRSFPGISCHTEIRRIEEDLEQRGLILRRLCENRMKPRKEGVKLKDPFPKFSLKNRNNQIQKKSPTTKQTAPTQYHNQNMNLLIQRHLQQMQNTIKEQ